MERRALQLVLGILSVIPLLGLAIAWGKGPSFFDDAHVPNALDNQFRYLAGVYVGAVSLNLWWAIPRIEARGLSVRIAAAAVFCGGIGRVVSMLSVGHPGDPTMVGGLALELGVVPLLVLWQSRVAAKAEPG